MLNCTIGLNPTNALATHLGPNFVTRLIVTFGLNQKIRSDFYQIIVSSKVTQIVSWDRHITDKKELKKKLFNSSEFTCQAGE